MFSCMYLNAGDNEMFVGSREAHVHSKRLLLAIFDNNHTEWKSIMPKYLQYTDTFIRKYHAIDFMW
jgi:hypothetical protein